MTLRLLLDQNFPRPPGFDLRTVESTVEAIHVYDQDRGLMEAGTPDWLIYMRAVQDGFDALVTRDWHQLEQPEELWVLSNLQLTVVSWRHPFNDPVAEWGTFFHTSRSSSAGSSGDSRGCSSSLLHGSRPTAKSTHARPSATTPPDRLVPSRMCVKRPSSSSLAT